MKLNKINPSIIITDDGSNSLFNANLNEYFHSTYGAITESKHIFIEAGLKSKLFLGNPIKILEIGFGTGLNALMTLNEIKSDVVVHYTGIELYTVDIDLVEGLNYCDSQELKPLKSTFLAMHHANWEVETQISQNFSLLKRNIDLRVFNPTAKTFDLIYFDAFSPNVQPELWTEEIFGKLYKSLNINGILVTYCSKGIVKRVLRSVGFEVKRLPGPPGKRHILKGEK